MKWDGLVQLFWNSPLWILAVYMPATWGRKERHIEGRLCTKGTVLTLTHGTHKGAYTLSKWKSCHRGINRVYVKLLSLSVSPWAMLHSLSVPLFLLYTHTHPHICMQYTVLSVFHTNMTATFPLISFLLSYLFYLILYQQGQAQGCWFSREKRNHSLLYSIETSIKATSNKKKEPFSDDVWNSVCN